MNQYNSGFNQPASSLSSLPSVAMASSLGLGYLNQKTINSYVNNNNNTNSFTFSS